MSSSTRVARQTMWGILLAVIVAIVVVVLLLSTYVHTRLDLTENKINTLSDYSIEVLKELVGGENGAEVTVRVYISPDLPDAIKGPWGQSVTLKGVPQKFIDKLEEYKAHSKGKMTIEYLEENIEEVAEKNGLEPFFAQEATVKEGKLEMKKYVLGCMFSYKGQVEVFPKALEPSFFEFEITRRLKRLKDKVEHGKKMRNVLKAAKKLFEKIQKCDEQLHAYEPVEENKEEMSGIEGLLKPIENMEQEAKALAQSRQTIKEKCSDVRKIFEQRAQKYLGTSKRFDAMLQGPMPERKKGGVEAYIYVLDEFYDALDTSPPNVQQIMELKKILTDIKDDVEQYKEQLESSPGEQKIGFVCGHGEFCPFAEDKMPIDPQIAAMMGQQNPMQQRFLQSAVQLEQQINEILINIGQSLFRERDFEVEKIDVTKPIPADIAALVIFGPSQDFSERELYEIDQYLMRGGTIVVFANKWIVSVGLLSEEEIAKAGPFLLNADIRTDYYNIQSSHSNLEDMLEFYGIKINGDLIADPVNNGKITLPQVVRRGRLVLRGSKNYDYPLFIYAKNFDRESPVVKSFPGITIPFATSLSFTGDESLKVTQLISSNDTSISISDPTNLGITEEETQRLSLVPQTMAEQLGKLEPNGPHVLALAVEGEFTSFFKGKEEPERPKDKDEEEFSKKEQKFERIDHGKGRILVVGSTLGIPSLALKDVFKDIDVTKITQGQHIIPQVRFQNWTYRLNQNRSVFGETIPFLFNSMDWAILQQGLADIRGKQNIIRPLEKISKGAQNLITYGCMVGLPILVILFGLFYREVSILRRKRLQHEIQKSVKTSE